MLISEVNIVKYVTRHQERDFNLPERRQLLLNNALYDLRNDPNVLGIYLAGSLSKDNYDNYSDIDLHTIIKPEVKTDFITEKFERPRKWGRVLFFEGALKTPVIVVHYDCFVKMDTWYHEPSELKPSVWLQGLKPLYDPEGMISQVFEKSSQISYQPTSQEVLQWRGKIFAYIHETYRSVMRNETFYAMSMLDKFRWMIAYGWYMEQGKRVDGAFGVWSKVEGDRSELKKWQLQLLEMWDCKRNPEEIMKTTLSMLPEFNRLNEMLSEKTGINADSELCREILNLVI
jgi:predicted nucleotidyltransferase